MADYKKLKPTVRKWEGGFSNHPDDKGGATMWGVTLETYRKVYGKNKTVNDLKHMTEGQWDYIFKKYYWDKWQADKIKSQSIANLVVDWMYNSGVYGIKYPQQVLGVKTDGVVGTKTISAINNYPNQKTLFQKLWNRRKKHYEDIVKAKPSQKVFLKGWMKRLNDFTWKG